MSSDDEDEGEVPQRVAALANASVPNERNLRTIKACKRCGLLKTYNQFLDDGCENCPFLRMAEENDKCRSYTTSFFEGQAAVMDPRESWVAKWLRTDIYHPGVYAISVTGTFDPETKQILTDEGYNWRCRPA